MNAHEFTPAAAGPHNFTPPTRYIWAMVSLEIPRPTLRARLIGFATLIRYAFTVALFGPAMGWTKDGPPAGATPDDALVRARIGLAERGPPAPELGEPRP